MQKIVKARFLCMERKFKTMSQHLLDIENLTVAVEDKEILHGVNLQVNEGETHVLMGPNGAGKTTLIKKLIAAAYTGEKTACCKVKVKGADSSEDGSEKNGEKGESSR